MERIKKGSIVARKSYNKDILFVVQRIIKLGNNTIALLKGLNIRIQADSNIEDLELVDRKRIEESEKRIENRFINRLQKKYPNVEVFKRNSKVIYTGKILHLDGELLYENVA